MKKIKSLSLLFLFVMVVTACNNKGSNKSSIIVQKDSTSNRDTGNTNKNPNTSGAQNAPAY